MYPKEVVEESDTPTSIRVRDTGIGISKEALKAYFLSLLNVDFRQQDVLAVLALAWRL